MVREIAQRPTEVSVELLSHWPQVDAEILDAEEVIDKHDTRVTAVNELRHRIHDLQASHVLDSSAV